MSRAEKCHSVSGGGMQPPESVTTSQQEQDPNKNDQDSEGEEHRRKRKREKEDEEERKEVCDFDETLDQALEDRAKQHNLTAVNVRNILHEVITNEHVVAMMKAAITDTEDMPLFEPKMTRSKLKEVVEKGVVIPTWNLSPIKKVTEVKVPQFVDIHLEEDDSSDEEYWPEEGDEDETAEESLLESDVESTASSPRGHKCPKVLQLPEPVGIEEDESADGQQEASDTPGLVMHIGADVATMGPPPPPKSKPTQDSTFMEKLHAVDEELAFSPMCMDSYQSLDESLIAFRTRSKRPLKDVPIGQLEAKLKAPDITPDMYEQNTADDDEWKKWLISLMEDDVGNEDEGDDDDDPEYNILEDLDEPDTEDLRNDRAVRITKKEVSELMEELFETFQDEIGFSHVDDEGPDEDSNQEAQPNFNTPQAIRFEEPLANLLNEQHRTVKAQLEFLRLRKFLPKSQPQGTDESTPAPEEPKAPPPAKAAPVMFLDVSQRRRLQQQMQQHIQLLSQMHLLTCQNQQLSQPAELSRMFLMELSSFAEKSMMHHRMTNPQFHSAFQPWNLKEALQLLHDFHRQVLEERCPPKPLKKNASEATSLPKHVAWIMATRPLFMYPELLPICALKEKGPRDRVYFTKAEDNLLALGLKHFEGTDYYKPLISKYLVTGKSAQQLTVRIKNLTMKKTPDNIIKFYKRTKLLPIMFKLCDDAHWRDAKAPVEREKHRLPYWLKANLSSIEEEFGKYKKEVQKFPLMIPPGLQLNLKPLPQRFLHRTWRQKRPSILKPLLIRPNSSSTSNNTNFLPKTVTKVSGQDPFPIGLYTRVPSLVPPVVPVQGILGIRPVDVPVGCKFQEVRPTSLCAPRPSRLNPTSIAPIPIAPAKVLQPAMLNQRARRLLGGMSKRRSAIRGPAFKSAPLVHSTPVIFAVPSTTLKLVSLGSPCGVIQPMSSSTGVPITTLLLNPPTIPLSQTIVPSPLNQTHLTEPESHVDSTQGDVQGQEETTFKEDDEWDCVSITIKVKEEGSLGPGGHGDCGGEGTSAKNDIKEEEASPCCPEKTSPEKKGCPFNLTQVPLFPAEQKPASECDPLETEQREGAPTCENGSGLCEQQVGQGLPEEGYGTVGDGSGAQEPSGFSAGQRHRGHTMGDKTKEQDGNRASTSLVLKEEESDNKEEEKPEDEAMEEEDGADDTQNPEAAESPKNTSSSTDGDMDISSPAGTQHDSSSPSGRPESGNDKDGAEEEEEEDFDDLTQDEDEEEISSASEESVLSVPELQETMEKLTWLASERRLSQEGDSEENSQEENSEQEEEEEEEGDEGIERSSQKEEEMTDEVTEGGAESAQSHLCPPLPTPAPTSAVPAGERRRGGSRGPGSHRVRSRRGRARTSKDASKLLLLYDENILAKDPLRAQKDMAFAQSYLNRVREALQLVPGKYEQFLQLIYQFEMSRQERTAMDLCERLRALLRDWPQLVRDFAAFLLPEEALECGLFEEQQAFDKSRKFLRQLEICFMENPAQHQKIIRLLQSCAECPLQEITKLKAQMWQLLRGHNHLQDEFSLFFDQLRPPASCLGDFEVMHWPEDKDYKFDGYEEVTLPELEEEEELGKAAAPRNKRKKDVHQEKEAEWQDTVGKECPCLYQDSSAEQRMKRSKRRTCSQCNTKVCESRAQRTREAPDATVGGPPRSLRQGSSLKELGECNHGNYWVTDPLYTGSPSLSSLVSAPGEGTLPPRDTQDRLCAEPSVGQRGSSDVSGADSNKTRAPTQRGSSASDCTSLGKARLATRDSPRTSAPLRSSRRSLCMKEPEKLPNSIAPSLGLNPTLPNVIERSEVSIIPSSSGSSASVPPYPKPLYPNIDKKSPSPTLEEQTSTMCAKNIKVSSSGEKVILWTREADRVILTMCQERGAQPETFAAISRSLGNKSADEVSRRFQELVLLFQTACVTSSDEEEEAGSTTEMLSDQEVEGED
ncbi:GON-4-like protein isoform X2 [Xenopus laevis]|uniref:GON-4-like protein n=1 Tax=Xenopus laevis TaxID=8355 RepID=A0A8J1LLX1_XENLA|nr:GON-4-like protein isoform X2 [Xenopus laevis]